MVNNHLHYKYILKFLLQNGSHHRLTLFNKLPPSDHSSSVTTAHLPTEQPQKHKRGCHRQQLQAQHINNLLLQKAGPLTTWLENTHPSPTALVLPSVSQQAQIQKLLRLILCQINRTVFVLQQRGLHKPLCN